jgi:transposase-like protein
MAKGKRRDQSKEAYWKQKLEEHGQSGSSIRAFCRQHRIAETAFYFWRRELARRQAQRQAECKGPQPKPPGPLFVPVTLAAEGPPSEQARRSAGVEPRSARIEIELSGDRRIHVTPPIDRQALADVLAVMEEMRPC